MEADKERRMIYSLLLEEKLEAFYLSFRTQLHVYRVEDLMHVTRKDLSSIGLLSGQDVRRFEKLTGRVTKNAGLKGIFTKVLPKKQKPLAEIPATVTMWEEFEPVIIKAEDLILKEILGAGNFGQVYQGEWIRRSGGHEIAVDVAVKCLKEESNESFIKEVSILSHLDQKHDNIIKLYGISLQQDSIRMVTEYAEEGSLLEKLQKGHIRLVSLLCQFAVQIASGMMYLEQKGLVHRDLAARNILVTAHNQVKISDFGLAKLVGKDNQWVMTAMEALPIRWLALESLLEGKFTSASDVWSFGVVLWEMFSFGEHPWATFTSKEVIEKSKNGERLPEPKYCPSNIYSIVMQRCWAENPSTRIKFEEARDNLISIHPTSSFALSSQQADTGLSYSVGEIIVALKPIEGQPNVWLGQNEKTLEFGCYIKSDTQPIQTKIPFTINQRRNSDIDRPSSHGPQGKSNDGERTKPRSMSIPIPDDKDYIHARRPPSQISTTSVSPPSPKLSADLSDTKHWRRKLSSDRKADCVNPSPAPPLPKINGTSNSSPADPFYLVPEETMKESEEGEMESARVTSQPFPDRLASGTMMRYPSMYVAMQNQEPTHQPGDETTPNGVSYEDEKPDLPSKPGRSSKGDQKPALDLLHNSGKSAVDRSRTSSTGTSDVNPLENFNIKKDAVKIRPKKPPRTSEVFYFDDSFIQAKDNPEQVMAGVAGNSYENSGVFDLDPSAWVNVDSTIAKERPVSDRDMPLPAYQAKTDVDYAGPKIKLHIPKNKQNSLERMKKLRKTQSLENLTLDILTFSPVNASQGRFEANQSNTVFGEKLEDPLAFSADAISYKKLENAEGKDGSKRRSFLGIKLRKKSGKERHSVGPPDNFAEIFVEVQQSLPNSTQPEISAALEISKWDAGNAIKYLKLSQLVKLGLCPETTCRDMLRTYDWNVLEASYAIKIHYVMAVHLDMSLEDAARVLRENNWDLDFVLNKLKIPAFIAESVEIGFNEAEAEQFLDAAGRNIDKALCNMKIKRVADITQKPENYCRTTLEHCQWKIDRAVTYIVESK